MSRPVAPSRARPEDLLVAAELLLADSATEFTDDQNWDTYSEIAEERQQAVGSVSLIDRLAGSTAKRLPVVVGLCRANNAQLSHPGRRSTPWGRAAKVKTAPTRVPAPSA
jgi:hypothetical protein